MNESEWLSCTDPTPMLEFLRGKVSDRKLRLFACACVYLSPCLQGEKIAERYADGEATVHELIEAWEDAYRLDMEILAAGGGGSYTLHASACHPDAELAARETVQMIAHEIGIRAAEMAEGRYGDRERGWRILEAEKRQVIAKFADLLREESVGNPFRSVIFDPLLLVWNDGIIPALAQTIYKERAFDLMPILADALEEAGFDDAVILNHLRGPGPHYRGCHVVDAILGKK